MKRLESWDLDLKRIGLGETEVIITENNIQMIVKKINEIVDYLKENEVGNG